MKTGQVLLIAVWALLELGCGGRSVLAQGKVDVLFPPAGSLPQGTGNPPSNVNSTGSKQSPAGLQQVSGVIPKGVVKSKVIARVNGSPILEEEVIASASMMMVEYKKRVQEQFWSKLEQELMQMALENLITDEAIIQDASIKIPAPAMKSIQAAAAKEFEKFLRRDKEVNKLKSDEEIKEYLQTQGKSIDLMRRQYIRSFLANQWIRELSRDKIDVETTREKLIEYYRSNPQEFHRKERVVWQHIYIDDDRYASKQASRQVAETVWQLMNNAKTEEEFSKIVAKYADGMSKARSGTGEGNHRGEIKPAELERFVFELPAGKQGPVVETARGYHVFRVLQHTPEEVLSFESVCLELRRKIDDRIYQGEYARLGKLLKQKVYIEMLNDGQ